MGLDAAIADKLQIILEMRCFLINPFGHLISALGHSFGRDVLSREN